jgi:hypothetical protein
MSFHTLSSSAVRFASAGRTQEDHAAFLERFAAREAQSRAAKKKPTLSIEQHASHRAQLSNVRFIQPKYSHETEINVSGIFKKWKRYAGPQSKPRERLAFPIE